MADDTDTQKAKPSPPSNESEPASPTVRAIVQRPIYYEPGHPPLAPGAEITLCTTTARAWLEAGIISLPKGITLPSIAAPQSSCRFPVFAKAAPPPPVSGG